MPKGTFWVWLAYLLIALVVLKFVPDKARAYLLVLLVLGGLYRVQQSPGGLNGFVSDLTGGNVNV